MSNTTKKIELMSLEIPQRYARTEKMKPTTVILEIGDMVWKSAALRMNQVWHLTGLKWALESRTTAD